MAKTGIPLKKQIRVCVICGKKYTPTNTMQKTCSVKCSNEREKQRKRMPVSAFVSLRRGTNDKQPESKPIRGLIGFDPVYPLRKCHDCGRPTYNYRCAKCWAKRGRKEDGDL